MQKMEPLSLKGKRAERLSTGVQYLFIILAALFFLMPLYFMLIGSFREMIGAMATPQLLPKNPTLKNYFDLINSSFPVGKWMFSSIFISTVTTVLAVLISCMMGYVFAKKSFPGKKWIFLLVITTMMLPKQASLIPLFLTVKKLGLVNSYWGVILPMISWPYGIFMMRQFMQEVPNELIEYAQVEGAGEIRIFTHVVMPLVKPSIATLAIIMFLQSWGDFMWQLIILKRQDMWTMNVGLSVLIRNASGGASIINYGLAMAGGCIAALPIVMLFLAFQKYFIKGVTLGAVKG